MSLSPDAAQSIPSDALLGVTVLVVEDEAILASTFSLVLQFAGAVSHSAANGRIALAMMRHQTFDVILCDRNMPVMSGTDFIRELNKRGETTPLLLFVEPSDRQAVEEAKQLRIAGTVSKPLSPVELVAAIRTASRASSEQRQTASA